MGTWTGPTQVKPIAPIRSDKEPDMATVKLLYEYVKTLANTISQMGNNLEYMINGHLDANNIRAKSITANRMDVDELSAITANLGTITAGLIRGIQIFGSYIATAEGTYPRSEMDVAGNLLAAYSSATQFVKIIPFIGSPVISIEDGVVAGQLGTILATLTLQSDNNLLLAATGGTAGLRGSGNVAVESTGGDVSLTGNTIYANGVPINSTLISLQNQIDNLQAQINNPPS